MEVYGIVIAMVTVMYVIFYQLLVSVAVAYVCGSNSLSVICVFMYLHKCVDPDCIWSYFKSRLSFTCHGWHFRSSPIRAVQPWAVAFCTSKPVKKGTRQEKHFLFYCTKYVFGAHMQLWSVHQLTGCPSGKTTVTQTFIFQRNSLKKDLSGLRSMVLKET